MGNDCMPLLGSRAAFQMQLIAIQLENIHQLVDVPSPDCQPKQHVQALLSLEDVMQHYGDVFEGTGLLEGDSHRDRPKCKTSCTAATSSSRRTQSKTERET